MIEPELNQQVVVLISDQDCEHRETLRDLLASDGYDAISAPPGEATRLLLEELDAKPCIVLLGKIMEPENGLQFLELMHHEEYLLAIALGLVSDFSTETVEVEEKPEARLIPIRPMNQLLKHSCERQEPPSKSPFRVRTG